MEEVISAKQLASELMEKVIPKLELEREKQLSMRMGLGLTLDPSDPYQTKWSYPKPLTAEESYLKARDAAGGELFARARKEVRTLAKIEKKALNDLTAFESKVERHYLFGKIIPNNALRLRRLRKDYLTVSQSYNESALRFENHLDRLRKPENRSSIQLLAQTFLEQDRKLQVLRAEADSRFKQSQQELSKMKEFRNSLLKLGDTQIRIKRKESLIAGLKLPTPVVEKVLPKNTLQFDLAHRRRMKM